MILYYSKVWGKIDLKKIVLLSSKRACLSKSHSKEYFKTLIFLINKSKNLETYHSFHKKNIRQLLFFFKNIYICQNLNYYKLSTNSVHKTKYVLCKCKLHFHNQHTLINLTFANNILLSTDLEIVSLNLKVISFSDYYAKHFHYPPKCNKTTICTNIQTKFIIKSINIPITLN